MALPVSYATVSNVYQNVPAVGSVSNLTSAAVAFQLGKAEAMINGKIAPLYSLPFTTVPPLIEAIATDMATYGVLLRIFTTKQLGESPWPDRYKYAAKLLDEIADGKLTLTDSAGALVTQRTDIEETWSNNSGYHPTFSDLGADVDRVDPDKIDDLEGDRNI